VYKIAFTVIQVVRNKQSDYIQTVKGLMQNCVYSRSPPSSDIKAYKQWLALTVDCCRCADQICRILWLL